MMSNQQKFKIKLNKIVLMMWLTKTSISRSNLRIHKLIPKRKLTQTKINQLKKIVRPEIQKINIIRLKQH